MDNLALPPLHPEDPLNCLSDEAKRRVFEAYLEAEKIHSDALETVEASYRAESGQVNFDEYCSKGQQAAELSKARMRAARVILSVLSTEYRAAGKSDADLRQLMQVELVRLAESAQLLTTEQDQLATELGLDWPGELAGVEVASTNADTDTGYPTEQPAKRFCWWGQPEYQKDHPFPEPQFSDPEARYRYERAKAEQQFRTNLHVWESNNSKNRPTVQIVSASTTYSTSQRSILLLAESLQCYISQFHYQALGAYADLLLDRRTPATEALRSFDQHAKELLDDTYARKWLFGLERLELIDELRDWGRRNGVLEEELEASFYWAAEREVDASVRHEFEELLWNAELEQATALSDEVARKRLVASSVAKVANISTSSPFTNGPGPEPIGAVETPDSRPRRKPGRPTQIPEELKLKALAVKGGKARAQILYQTKFPTSQQIKNVATILRHYRQTHPR